MTALLIEDKCREMLLYGYQALKQFPKHETHVLGAEIRLSMLQLQRLVITAFRHASHANTYNLKKALLSKPFRRNRNE